MKNCVAKIIRCAFVALLLSAVSPSWAFWKTARHSSYIGLVEMRGGLSGFGSFMDIEMMTAGIYRPKPL